MNYETKLQKTIDDYVRQLNAIKAQKIMYSKSQSLGTPDVYDYDFPKLILPRLLTLFEIMLLLIVCVAVIVLCAYIGINSLYMGYVTNLLILVMLFIIVS